MNALRLKLARLILGDAGIIFPSVIPVARINGWGTTFEDSDSGTSAPTTYVYADSHITNE